MQLVYVTTDEVQQADGANWANDCGIRLAVQPRFQPYDGLLIDLDSLPPRERQQMLEWLTNGPAVAAVHSYSLTESETSALEANGVKVFRRLEQDVFAELAQEVHPDDATAVTKAVVVPFRPLPAFASGASAGGQS